MSVARFCKKLQEMLTSIYHNTHDTTSEHINYLISELFCINTIEQLILEHGEEFFNEISGYGEHYTISEKTLQMYLEQGNVTMLTPLIKSSRPTPYDFEFGVFSIIDQMVFEDRHKKE